MLQRFGAEQREVLGRLSEPRQNKKGGPVHGFEARGGEREHSLGGGAAWPKPLRSEWGEEDGAHRGCWGQPGLLCWHLRRLQEGRVHWREGQAECWSPSGLRSGPMW